MRRDFGPKNFNHSPTSGYERQQPHYISERNNFPIPYVRPYVSEPQVMHEDLILKEPTTERVADSTEVLELGNTDLPIYVRKQEIKQAIRDNQLVLITAETGAGKSTQVPQYLLEMDYTITMTQPRRMAARKVADRIQEEIVDRLKDPLSADLVGWHTAEKSTVTDTTRVTVLTDGLRLVQELNEYGHAENEVLLIDEVHEWNANIEVLIAWVKRSMAENPKLKVVIMSATMDAHRLAHYFSEVCDTPPPIIEVEGRTFELERHEQPESTVLERTMYYAEQGKNMLIFMPGKREIYDLIDELQEQLPQELRDTAMILPLHAKMSPSEQEAAYGHYPGIKIIVATNVAQTSLTIPGIDVVIDSGLERRVELDEEGIEGLVFHSVSRSDCDQRGGRAAREKPGIYELTKLNKDMPFVPYIARELYPLAEILRSDTDRNTLRVAAIGLDLAELDLFHPVDRGVIERSKHALRILGALDDENNITPTGERMNKFPINPSSARMMVEADRYSPQTRAYLAAITAAAEVGGLPYFAYNVGKAWKSLSDDTSSDLLRELDIFIAIQDMDTTEMDEHDLDVQNVIRARELYEKVARRSKAERAVLTSPTEQQREDLKKCIYMGMIDFVYKNVGDKKFERINGTHKTLRELSNRSTVQGVPNFVVGHPYRFEKPNKGEWEVHHIIERVTILERPQILGEIALKMCEWRPVSIVQRSDGYREVQRQYFNGIDIGVEREVESVPSAELRDRIIEDAQNKPGPVLRQLRDLKRHLEELQHKAKEAKDVPQITADDLTAWVGEAAPADILDPWVIENNLLKIMQRENMDISAALLKKIIDDAPSYITPRDVTLSLEYRNGKPLVKRYDSEVITAFSDEIYLRDGRQVLFVGEHGKHYTVAALRKLHEKKTKGSDK